MISKGILFLSNGHGEDAINCQILHALRASGADVDLAAMPIVGDGAAYRRSRVPIIGPTSIMPSGGVFYMNPLFFLKDVRAGLVRLTFQQLQAAWMHSQRCDLVVATGDIVAAGFAHATGRPYIIFLSAHSSYYEGQVYLGFLLNYLLLSEQCLAIFTRDGLTAADLKQQGFEKAIFVGNPVMDNLNATGKDLELKAGVRTIALLPGSRLPEATENLILLLELVKEIAANSTLPVQFRAALVPSLMLELDDIEAQAGWLHREGKLVFPGIKQQGSEKAATVEVICYSDAFADILQQSNLVIGMTGSAIEQAVGLGKPVITIPGNGPSFTYRFAEAQNRLLGDSVQVIGTEPANDEIIKEAALAVDRTWQNKDYLKACIKNGLERMGKAGGSQSIANYVTNYLQSPMIP
ncbi:MULTISPECIES: lipid-A-disaccharide synthase-related protein [unclassified Microcoleus]|uniref:lipid-A-disaccharide synthase-related protein n=1 Tax=unclassified Microcoleus TaxID=2642155 RepID=UPI002FCEC54D